MLLYLSPAERAELRDRYRRAHGEVAFPVMAAATTKQEHAFALNDKVTFQSNGMMSERVGVIALFIEMDDPVYGQGTYAIVLTDDEPRGRRQYRVPVAHLRHTATP